jgi:AcrR family transcriptional regulator
MRTVKKREERKNEILDIGAQLFTSHGYDAVSVQQILDAAGIAKGTFYYYFTSKESVMDGIINRYTDMFVAAAKAIAENPSLSISQKLSQAISALKMKEPQGLGIIEEMHKPQNALMHQKMLAAFTQRISPVLSRIIRAGIKEELFDCPYPDETVEMLMIYAQVIFDSGITTMTEAETERRRQAFLYNSSRLFGLEPDSLLRMEQVLAGQI